MNEAGWDRTRRRTREALAWVGDRLDPLAALVAGFAAVVAGLFGLIHGDELTTATLGVLVVVAFSLVHERTLRLNASRRIDEVLGAVGKTHDAVKVLDIGAPYHVVISESTWDISEDGSARVVRWKKVRFAQDDVIAVVDWYTGDGTIGAPTYKPGKAVHPFVSDGRTCMLVALDRPYARDEERDLIIERTVEGAFPKNPDRVWTMVLDSTSLLRMVVRWPATRPPTAVRLHRRSDLDRGKPTTVHPVMSDDGRLEFTAEIQEPERGERMGIEWDWEPPPTS